MIESASLVDKNNKPESQPKIWSVAAESVVVWAAMVDGLMPLGLTLRMLDCQLDGCLTLQTGVSHTVSLHVIIIQQVGLSHVVQLSQLPNVKNPVSQDMKLNTKKIFITQKKFTQFQKMSQKFKHKF